MTGEEHLAWCKRRAFEYLDAGNVSQAFASFASDMGKHRETKGHLAVTLGMQMMMIGELKTVPEMRKFIDGFN